MTQEPDVWRRIQSETRVQLQGPYQDQESILSLLLPTLHVLGLAPQDDLLARDVERCRPLQMWDIDEAQQQDERFQQAFQSRAWLQDLQAALLGPIANDWSEELDRRGKWQPLLQAFFCPTRRSVKQPSSGLIVLAEPAETDTRPESNVAGLWASGLQIFASTLSHLSSQPSSPTPTLREALLKVASFYMKSGTTLLNQLLTAYEVESNPAKRQLAWQEAVVVLNSLPIKLANAFKGDVPKHLSAIDYFASLSSQILDSLSSSEANSQRITALAALLSKLLRAGNIATTRLSETDFAKGFWPIAISKASGRFSDSGLKKRLTESWSDAYSCMEARDRLILIETFIVCLDRITARQGLGNLVSPSEHGKAAQCGKVFLSQEATRLCELQMQLLEVFVGTQSSSTGKGKSSSSPEDSDDEDGQGEVDSPFSLFASIVLRHDVHLSPLTTRSICRYISEFGLATAQGVLLDVVDHWGGSARTKRASVDQEQYLTVLLLGLLAEVAKLTGNGSRIGQTISRRSNFIEGVGAHLEHLDPQIRRLGMLLAEVVSERAHAENQSTGGGQTEGPKAIDFGRSMWDGMGEGKEEARILRAMFHSWSSLTTDTGTISPQEALEILGLLESAATEAQPELLVVTQPAKRQPPSSTSLPRKVPAKASKQARPLISLVDDVETGAAPPTQARITAIESDDEGSSSESDSSDDDAGPSSDHKGFAEPDMPLGGLDTSSFKPSAKSTSKKNAEPVPGEQFEVNDRKRRRPPIYMHEIASMLRERDRDPIRIALKHGEALIRKKAGWGGEVYDNSIDLAFLLVGLQNNFKIKSFEERRTGILTALVVASPRLTTGTIIEQFFTDNYSLAQRFSILNALASGTRELAGLAPITSSKTRPQVEGLAEDLSNTAISRAKAEGTERVPEVKREQAFKLTSRPGAGRTAGAIQELNGSSSSIISRGATSDTFAMLPGAVSRPKERYVDLSSSVFLFPLINRFSAHIREASARYSRTTAHSSRHSFTSAPGGYGTSTLFDPMLLSALLDTLSVLAHASRNSLDFLAVIAPEILELSLLVVGSALPLSIIGSSDSSNTTKEKQQEEASHRISGSILSLNLVILDTSYLLDSGKTLLRDQSRLVDDVASWAAEIFQALEHVISTPSTKDGGVKAFKEAMGSSRAARASAAVLLRIEEMRSQWREERFGPRR